jgi:hypothetical protein
MPQYAVLIYEAARELPPEVISAHGRLPDRVVAGLALEPNETATAIRGDLLTDGPFVETKEAILGVYVLEARDLDHAIALARMTPIVDGGVEVRPMNGFQVR